MLVYLLIPLAFAADRLAKIWAAAYLSEHGPTEFNRLFSIRETYNRGIAFGLLQGVGPAVGWLSILILILLAFYLRRLPPSLSLARVGLALVIGGALGNLIDRVTAGQVLDFIQVPIRIGVFNVADVLIQVGIALSILGLFLQQGSVASNAG